MEEPIRTRKGKLAGSEKHDARLEVKIAFIICHKEIM